MMLPARRRPLLLGHRGARHYAPENTLAAFELALEHGCDGFECDVRLTADSQAVICHDEKLRGRLVARSHFDDLRTHATSNGIELCCLSDLLQRFASRAFLDIELKISGLEAGVGVALGQWPLQRGYYVSSFLPKVLEHMHATNDTIPLGLICGRKSQLAQWTRLAIEAVFLERKLASPGLLKQLQAAGKQVFVWTVNTASEMRRFAELGVDGIISDDTKLLARTFPFDSRLV